MDLDIDLHKKQGVVLVSQANEILYGGAAGGGKSHLMRCLAIILCCSVPGLQVYLFRRNYGDLYKNHMEGSGSFPELLWKWINAGLVKVNLSDNYIRFWNKAKIHLCHLHYEKNLLKYQGPEIHVLMMDELTHFSEKEYRFLRNRVRLGGLKIPDIELVPGMSLRSKLPLIVCGSNPGSKGHNWVKRTFVNYAPAEKVTKTPKEEGGMKRAYIPARLEDNPTLLENDPDYIDRLEGLGNPALVKAMRDGDWDIVAGGALDDVWNKSKQVIPRFKVPSSWFIDRSFDWGSTHPFSVLWHAESDGTEAELPDGSIFCPPKGSIVVCHEWYGAKGPNEGLKMSAVNIAEGILKKEKELLESKWFPHRPKPGPADNQISSTTESSSHNIEKKMSDAGVKWTVSDKKPGSRVNGLELLRSRLEESSKEIPEDPCLYIMDHCVDLIGHLPVLKRSDTNPDDVDTKSEDHDYDALRYRVLDKRRVGKVQRIRGLVGSS